MFGIDLNNKFFTSLLFATALSVGLVAPSPARADYISPEKVSLKTKTYNIQSPPLESGDFEYDVSWQGIPVASSVVSVSTDNSAGARNYVVETNTKTAKVIDLLYRLRHKSQSVFTAGSMLPVSFFSLQKENSRRNMTEILFDKSGNISSRRWKDDKEVQRLSFTTGNATLDPITAAFFAKSIPIKIGNEVEVDVFNGKNRYLITFKILGREKIEVNNKQYDTFRISPRVQKLTDTEVEKRLKYAELWITADDKREVVQLKSEVAVGKITAQLQKFTPRPNAVTPPNGLLRAQLSHNAELLNEK